MNYKKFPAPTEDQEQAALFEWANLSCGAHPELALLVHIPNEGKRSVQTGANLKRIGLKPGFPDIMLPVARHGYHGLFIELKRSRGGQVSDNQKWWIDKLNQQGYYAVVCFGLDEAISVISKYLNIKF